MTDSRGKDARFDIAVIGAGVVGAAIARELASTGRSVVLLEAAADVGAGTSKANTAILHTGFDAEPGTLEARLVARGYELLGAYCRSRTIALERTGAYLVAWDDEQLAQFPRLLERAEANGYRECTEVGESELRTLLPHLGPGARGAIGVPGESIVDPWSPPIAFATDAIVRAGAELRRSSRVLGVERRGDDWKLTTPSGTVRAEWIVNAAGLRSDEVDRMLGYATFTVTPRRGELIVFDKLARPLVDQIVLPVPVSATKGVLVSPTVFGNVLLGPTAEDLADKTDTGSSRAGISALLAAGRRIMPELVKHEVTAVYAGLRAATEHDDYCITVRTEDRTATVGGIRSTGLTASLAIAEYVREQMGIDAPSASEPLAVPPLGEAQLRPYRNATLIERDPAYGTLVCFCERVSAGEIRDALESPIPPVDLDGLRRRTRAHTGRCQGFHCAATLVHGWATSAAMIGEPQSAHHDVVIVGAGPAGLALAEGLARQGTSVVLLERESEPGGIPRHSQHRSFGMLDLHRLLRGPDYARRRVDRAVAAGATIRVQHSVTGWDGDRMLVTSPSGLATVNAPVIVLATGSRERPRSARLVPGDRPPGVMTTGTLQRLVAANIPVGTRAVVVGAEHVSYSAVLTLRRAGVRVVAMLTESHRHETFAAFALTMRALGVPLRTNTTIAAIRGRGRGRVDTVELADGTTIECDTVVFTGDWVADDELLRTAPPHSGLLTVGNVRLPGRRADQCAIEARRMVDRILRHLETGLVPDQSSDP